MYHHKIDGQIIRVNQVIEDILMIYCSQEPSKWIQYLHLVAFAYNSLHHQSIGTNPFNTLYGQECLSPLKFLDSTLRVEASYKMIEEMENQMNFIHKVIQVAQDHQKHYANGESSNRHFCKGDMVFLHVISKRSTLSLGRYKNISS